MPRGSDDTRSRETHLLVIEAVRRLNSPFGRDPAEVSKLLDEAERKATTIDARRGAAKPKETNDER